MGPSLGHREAVIEKAKCRGRILRDVVLQPILRLAILISLVPAVAFADGMNVPIYSRGGLEAKIQYCKDCHGLSGQGYRGYFPMPRLAGQTTEYFESQLRAFIERRRERNISIIMSKAHGLGPEMRIALANHFRGLNPAPIGGAPRNLVEVGRKIYEEGVPESNVPACSACHGPEAKGDGSIPRLAGQLYPYTVKELVDWAKERGQAPASDDTQAIMAPIAHSLNKSQIQAIAAYLSYLR